MKKHFRPKRILLYLLLIFAVLQFFPANQSQPPVHKTDDFITILQPPPKVESLLKNACYDCHSHETKYPWYSNLAPVSWWLQHHIEEGRDHLNFSLWGLYKSKKQDHKLEECEEMTAEGHMPLNSYTWLHSNAKLSPGERKMLAGWFKAMRERERF